MYRVFLALRWLLSRPINVLGMLGVTVGAWALILVVSIFSGFIKEVRQHVRAASADVTVQYLAWGARFADLERTILADPNVAACAPRLVWFALLHALGKHKEVVRRIEAIEPPGAESPFTMLVGIDAQRELELTGLRAWLAAPAAELRVADAAAPFALAGGRPGILLSAHRIGKEFVEPGALVKVTTGRLPGGNRPLDLKEQEFVLCGAFATHHVAFDANAAFAPIADLRALMGPGDGDVVNEIVIELKDRGDDVATAARLQRALRDAHPRVAHGARVRTWEQIHEPFLSAVEHQRFLMKVVLFVIMVVAAFLMYATLSMMVAEKTRDIGILTALGASRGGVLQVFLTCGLAIALCGAGLGVALGWYSAVNLDGFNRWLRGTFGVDLFPSAIYNLRQVPSDVDPEWLLMVAALAVGTGVVVSVLPAWRAARHDPLQSLRNE
jgi:ABC-type lipoprotein release transport system permease subunit